MDIKNETDNIIKNYLGIDSVDSNKELYEYGTDVLDEMEIRIYVEDKFSIWITDEQWDSMTCINDLYSIIKENMKENNTK